MTRRLLTEAVNLAQIPAARAREAEQRKKGLRACSARYDRKSARIELGMSSGYLFAFLVNAIAALKSLTPAELAAVETDVGGDGLRWDALDIDLSVAGLLLSAIGETEQRRQLASLAGKVKSIAKAKACREDGAKGGRPRGVKSRA